MTEIATAVEATTAKAHERSQLIIASSPHELVAGHRTLIEETEHRRTVAIDDAQQAKAMVEQCKAAKIGTRAAQRIHDRATERVHFLSKVVSALKQGFCMVPDMAGDLFAIRIGENRRPAPQELRSDWNYQGPRDHSPDRLDEGDGKYVSPAPQMRRWMESKTGTDNKPKAVYCSSPVKFRDPDGLDRRFVRPEVVSRTAAAMRLRLFDEIVCVRGTGGNVPRRGRDPIVLGRIVGQQGSAAFLIAWFVDPEEL